MPARSPYNVSWVLENPVFPAGIPKLTNTTGRIQYANKATSQIYTFEPRPIGKGAFAAVYHGINAFNGSRLVAKVQPMVCLPIYTAEIRALARLGELYGKDRTQAKPWGMYNEPRVLVTFGHYYPGKTLEQIKQANHALPLEEKLDIARKLIAKIQRLYKNGILHRDIKLENVLYDISTKELNLIDFGFADLASEPGLLYDRGTPFYTDFSCSKKTLASLETEIYALGINFLRLFSDWSDETLFFDIAPYVEQELSIPPTVVSHHLKRNHTFIPELETLILNMTHPKQRNKGVRPTLKEIDSALETIEIAHHIDLNLQVRDLAKSMEDLSLKNSVPRPFTPQFLQRSASPSSRTPLELKDITNTQRRNVV